MATCPHCGQEYNPNPGKPFVNVMSEYIDLKTGKVDGIYNLDDDFIELPDGRKLVKKGVKVSPETKPVQTTAPAKEVQTAPSGKVPQLESK